MATEQERLEAYKILRGFLNKAFKGENVDAILHAFAHGGADLIYNAQAVHDNVFIISSSGRYLDILLGDRNVRRPANVGLDDEDFKKLGIGVTTRKQVRDLILFILETIYGFEYSRAVMNSTEVEPYNLIDQDLLILQFDDGERINVKFETSQFSNISSATAREVADSITRGLRKKGKQGFATVADDGFGAYVMLVSPTTGPSSTIKVLGGRSQNELKFPAIRSTSQTASTQLTLSLESGGVVRATWTGGSNPSFGKVRAGDYVNAFSSGLSSNNMGTFTIMNAVGGTLGNAYVEWQNPIGTQQVVTLGSAESLLFFEPKRETLISKPTFTAAYQVEENTLEIFLPAITRVVRRDRIDASYVFDSIPSNAQEQAGSYLYDIAKPYVIGSQSTLTTARVDSSSSSLISVVDATDIPDQAGHLVFGFGTAKEEGPIPYLGRPGSSLIRLNPTYQFKFSHAAGTDISFISRNAPIDINPDGTDYPVYLTDISGGRKYAEQLINSVTATGINLIINVIFPNDIGLGKFGTIYSEKFQVFGE